MIRKYLPYCINKTLFGDRELYGLKTNKEDPDWKEWESQYLNFYYANQKKSIGKIVNDAGYKILKNIPLNDKTVLEVGPGDIEYLKHIPQGNTVFHLVDINSDMLQISSQKILAKGFRCNTALVPKDSVTLPFDDESIDVVIAFYCLEHIYPLKPYMLELKRVLKKGGVIIGAVPCEGGLAWGLGRYLTTRRWFKQNTTIDPDKIICWEHPNYADAIHDTISEFFLKKESKLWPLPFLAFIDFNLISTFIYIKE